MWCCCCTSEEESVRKWEDQMSSIIKNVKKARNLGKQYAEKARYGRSNDAEEQKIVDCFREIDHDLLSVKLAAIDYLISNTTLRNHCIEQIEYYKLYARKQYEICHLEQKISELEEERQMGLKENDILKAELQLLQQRNKSLMARDCNCKNDSYIVAKPPEDEERDRVILLTKQHHEKMYSKHKKLIAELENLIAEYDKKLEQLKAFPTKLENEESESTIDQFNLPSSSQSVPTVKVHESWSKQESENRNLLRLPYGSGHKPKRFIIRGGNWSLGRYQKMFSKGSHDSNLSKDASDVMTLQPLKEEDR